MLSNVLFWENEKVPVFYRWFSEFWKKPWEKGLDRFLPDYRKIPHICKQNTDILLAFFTFISEWCWKNVNNFFSWKKTKNYDIYFVNIFHFLFLYFSVDNHIKWNTLLLYGASCWSFLHFFHISFASHIGSSRWTRSWTEYISRFTEHHCRCDAWSWMTCVCSNWKNEKMRYLYRNRPW